jgi:PTH1 family peptidyl-tRNA hydrolase
VRNLVIGLGNPGPRYVFTKHNVGFLALDKYEEAKKNISNIKKISGKNFEGFSIENDIFIKPLTYMNASGEVLPYVFKKFGKIDESLVIIYDDIWLNLGEIRIRKNGSDGGHNGLKSIIAILKSTDFLRIRIGINNGYEHGSGNLANYVLSPFTQEEWTVLNKVLDYVTITIDLILEGRINEAMNKFNKKII